MGRAACVVYALFLAAGLGVTAGAVSAQPAPDFGSPPSGQYPILFNDHHVYAKPDVDKQNRVLAALVRGKTILVPLRSMFEQMGATVEYDPATRTAIVAKPGSEVRVTVGKPEVVINGESRPLDVPPEIHDGAILVPLRVISEGMGAYVMWVPEKRAVVVRYIPAPPPTPAPPPPPPATPMPTEAPIAPATFCNAGTRSSRRTASVTSSAISSGWPKTYNEFDAGHYNTYSNDVRGGGRAACSPVFTSCWRASTRRGIGTHAAGTVTQLGGTTSSLRAGVRTARTRI